MIEHLWCDDEVSRNLSIASTAVLSAVENPIVNSVDAISLSIVPGIPIHLIPNSQRDLAPRYVP